MPRNCFCIMHSISGSDFICMRKSAMRKDFYDDNYGVYTSSNIFTIDNKNNIMRNNVVNLQCNCKKWQ